jgi:hypothetical protein
MPKNSISADEFARLPEPSSGAPAGSGDVVEAQAGTKERVLYLLKMLIQLVENDQLRASEIAGLTTSEILGLAERKAAEAETGAQDLKNIQD